jgi:hypothetical protein
MTLPGEQLNVVLKIFARLLPATFQIPGVAWSNVCTLEAVGEDLLEIFLTIDRVSGQVVKLGHSHVG